jgi:hypothetical protein
MTIRKHSIKFIYFIKKSLFFLIKRRENFPPIKINNTLYILYNIYFFNIHVILYKYLY